jgi:hypothetical protein
VTEELDRDLFDLVRRRDRLDKLDFLRVSAMVGLRVEVSASELLFSEKVLGRLEKATILCS